MVVIILISLFLIALGVMKTRSSIKSSESSLIASKGSDRLDKKLMIIFYKKVNKKPPNAPVNTTIHGASFQ